MANTVLTPTIIAREALMILENNLVMTKLVFDGYQKEFSREVNGYNQGSSITVRRPAQFGVRNGRVMQVQDVVEGSTTINLDQQLGVDFEFTSADLTLNIKDLGDRVMKPAVVPLANAVDAALTNLYKDVYNWVGTPGQVINSFDDFAVGTERLNELAVPMEDRVAVLNARDDRGMKSQQTALYIQGPAGDAYRKGKIGMIDNVDTYMDQNVKTHTVGVATGTPLVNGANQVSTYDAVKNSFQQTLNTDGWTNSTTNILRKGDVFTIANVFAVNPVDGTTKSFLRQFVVVSDVNSGASTGPAALTISPPIITSGPQQTVSAAPADDAPITVLGTGGVGYGQSMIFHENAFAFVSAPLAPPNDGRKFARESYKGINVRVVPVYDGVNDLNKWRLDILFGVKTLDPRLATRISGTP